VAVVDSLFVRAFGGGEQTGPSPVDRRKKGSKHTLLVDRHGVPLAIRTAGANASDHTQIIPIVLDFPHLGGKPGLLRLPRASTRTVGGGWRRGRPGFAPPVSRLYIKSAACPDSQGEGCYPPTVTRVRP
jgi:hypothetical protein